MHISTTQLRTVEFGACLVLSHWQNTIHYDLNKKAARTSTVGSAAISVLAMEGRCLLTAKEKSGLVRVRLKKLKEALVKMLENVIKTRTWAEMGERPSGKLPTWNVAALIEAKVTEEDKDHITLANANEQPDEKRVKLDESKHAPFAIDFESRPPPTNRKQKFISRKYALFQSPSRAVTHPDLAFAAFVVRPPSRNSARKSCQLPVRVTHGSNFEKRSRILGRLFLEERRYLREDEGEARAFPSGRINMSPWWTEDKLQ